ncbi:MULTISPECIES: hypothetical protein [Streptomyces]|uniref:hypothetical protein n=1 Tax=Streptomyces TaxID=1883 RepID=UPI0003814F27|nr:MULTISPECIES: hypothetical protein [unclassified Streptomyces]
MQYPSTRMPAGAMVILSIYTSRALPSLPSTEGRAVAPGLAVTIGLHLWRREALLSIFVGSAVCIEVLPPVRVAPMCWPSGSSS